MVERGPVTGKPGKLVASGTYDAATDKSAPVAFVRADAAKQWGSIVVNGQPPRGPGGCGRSPVDWRSFGRRREDG